MEVAGPLGTPLGLAKVRKGTEKASDRHQKGDGECPPRRSKQGSYILFNWLFGSVQSLSRV